MLAAAVKVEELHRVVYPKVLQVKYDGIRAIIRQGRVYSRSGKLLPNKHVQQYFTYLYNVMPEFDLIDGELMVGDPTDNAVCMNTTSGIMSIGGQPDFTFYTFDRPLSMGTYNRRRQSLVEITDAARKYADRIRLVGEFQVNNASDVRQYLDTFLSNNLEGCILRDPHSPYKNGRSTVKQGYLLKVKDIRDDEAIVIGYEELNHNNNVPQVDALGYTKRSTHKDNKVGGNKLGAFIVANPRWPSSFKVGTGFTDTQRIHFWRMRETYIGYVLKFKYLAAGMKDLPRHPVMLGWRDASDMDQNKLEAMRNYAASFR